MYVGNGKKNISRTENRDSHSVFFFICVATTDVSFFAVATMMMMMFVVVTLLPFSSFSVPRD